MKDNYKKFETLKVSELHLIENKLKEEIKKALNKEYAKNEYLQNLNSEYLAKQTKHDSLSRFLLDLDIKKELGKILDISKEFDIYNSHDIKILANLSALKDFLDESYAKENAKDESASINSSIIWEGENQTEFVQMIYSLYHSGILTNIENEKTKLVKQIASYFNIQLSKNWQSNLSKAVNNRNNDYEPQIIKKMQMGYDIYKKEIKAKKNKSK